MLHTSVDNLFNGKSDERPKASLKNTDVLNVFKDLNTLPDKGHNTLLKVIGTYIRGFRAKQAYKTV